MDRNIRQLFDYQYFAENDRLAALIRETESRYGEKAGSRRELTEEESSLIHAAAGLTIPSSQSRSRIGKRADHE